MIVGDLSDRNRRHAVKVDTTVVREGDRFMIGFEDKPEGMNEVHRVLPLAIFLELVSSVG